MAFDDIRFPTAISRGSTGGPERRTEIVVTGSGGEERNSRWANSRRCYNAGFGVKSLDDVHAVVRFFEERRGRLHGFRWKDHTDFKSGAPSQPVSATDQAIGVGDGTTATFQLVKRYGTGLRDYVRAITKPVAGTIVVAVNGVPEMNVTVDPLSGLTAYAGCDKQFGTCRAQFANAVNFRGFPHIPGEDFVLSYARRDDPANDGRSRV